MNTTLIIYTVSGLNICLGLSVFLYCLVKNKKTKINPDLVDNIGDDITITYTTEEVNEILKIESFTYEDIEETDL